MFAGKILRAPFGVSAFVNVPAVGYAQPATVQEFSSDGVKVSGMAALAIGTIVDLELHLFIPVSEALAARGIPHFKAEVSDSDLGARTMWMSVSGLNADARVIWEEFCEAMSVQAKLQGAAGGLPR